MATDRSFNIDAAVRLFVLFATVIAINCSIPAVLATEKSLSLTELWRIESDSSKELWFGKVGGVVALPDGPTFVIDPQKLSIYIVSPEGDLVGSIGRGGEGPGDIPNRPSLFLSDGNLAVTEMSPANISYFSTDGEFLDRISIPTPDGAQMNLLFKCRQIDGGLVVEGEITKLVQPIESVRYLSILDPDGVERHRIVEAPRTVNGKSLVHNMMLDRFDNRWCAGTDRVYTTTEYSKYWIEIWDPDGRQVSVIKKQYEHLKRNKSEQKALKSRLEKIFRNSEIKLTEFHRDIEAIHLIENQFLLVLTSRGARTDKVDSMGRFDVYTADGNQIGTLSLIGQGNPLHDRYIFSGNRLFVVIESLPAHYDCFRTLERPLEPMTLICYDLDAGQISELFE